VTGLLDCQERGGTRSLPAARYRTIFSTATGDFPALELTLPAGWSAVCGNQGGETDTPQQLLLAKDEAELEFLIGFRVYDPRKGGRGVAQTGPQPDDFLRWLERHPRLDAGKRSRTTVGGLRGTQLDTEVLSVPKTIPARSRGNCLPLTQPRPFAAVSEDSLIQPACVPQGYTIRWIRLDNDGTEIVIRMSARRLPAFAREVRPVLDSIRPESFEE
jgi:hypothetical protein